MIVGIGTDIVEVKRLKAVVKKFKKEFLKKIFTDNELAYSYEKKFPYLHLAARFAAKEAVFKAFGDGLLKGGSWRDIEIKNNSTGKPVVKLNGKAKKVKLKRSIQKVIISLAHTKNYATATAILISKS